jgi:hypothetical protein
MSEVKKLSQEDFDAIKAIRQESLESASILGELEFQKTIIDHNITEQKTKVIDIKRRESQLMENLTQKYGRVSVNIETGEIS